MTLIVDGHEDLALNVLADGRDYLTSARAIRAAEADSSLEDMYGRCMLGLDEWLEARVGVIVAVISTIPREHARLGEMSYAVPEGAARQARAQLQIYREWNAEHPRISVIETARHLEEVLESWAGPASDPDERRIGLVLLIENADSIRDVDELSWWREQGVRMIGPAWHSNRYSGSTKSGGPLTELGRALLDEMACLGLVLDLTHMSDEASREALDRYQGAVVASHANSRRSVPIDRLLPDEIIRGIAERDGVVGIMPLNWALDPEWKSKGKAGITLDSVVDAVDEVCQLTGNARHVAVGSDFDGGQGAESAPAEIETIADLPKLAPALRNRGYTTADIEAIMSGNWLRVLRRVLPTA